MPGSKPKMLAPISTYSLITCKILANTIFSNSLVNVSERLMER